VCTAGAIPNALELETALLLGTHFTCFTGTKVQILTQKAPADNWAAGPEPKWEARGTKAEVLLLFALH